MQASPDPNGLLEAKQMDGSESGHALRCDASQPMTCVYFSWSCSSDHEEALHDPPVPQNLGSSLTVRTLVESPT